MLHDSGTDLGTKQERETVLRGDIAFIAQSGKVSDFLAKDLQRTV